MPIIFAGQPGRVVQLDDPAMACATNFLSLDPGIDFSTERSIVTRLVVSQQVNIQFLHTLGALVHVYVFGDRMGQVSLSGLSFPCACPEDGMLGSERMLMWYKQHRASKRASPVRVTMGQTVIEGFVTRFTEDVVDPSIKLVQWGVDLASLPEDA